MAWREIHRFPANSLLFSTIRGFWPEFVDSAAAGKNSLQISLLFRKKRPARIGCSGPYLPRGENVGPAEGRLSPSQFFRAVVKHADQLSKVFFFCEFSGAFPSSNSQPVVETFIAYGAQNGL
jgi:hypothetical protein